MPSDVSACPCAVSSVMITHLFIPVLLQLALILVSRSPMYEPEGDDNSDNHYADQLLALFTIYTSQRVFVDSRPTIPIPMRT
jgi:hypothetical protein